MRGYILIFALLLSVSLHAEQITPKARSVIFIYLDGGPSQTDTFDPKPNAGRDYAGNYRQPIETNVKGVFIGEKLPRLAKMADKYSIIRSMTHSTNAHETGHYYMTTGDMTKGAVVYPSYGAVIAYFKEHEYRGDLPIYVTLTEASTRFNESGFLGPKYKSFETGGNPSSPKFSVEGIINSDIADSELTTKRTLLYALDSLSEGIDRGNAQVVALDEYRDKTYSLILGDAREVFNLSGVPAVERERYGRTPFGQSCLVAERLVKEGVVFVSVRFKGWDTHKEHFARMDERLNELDKGVSSLLEDLQRDGLLDSTIVLVGGEFGRTPKIGWEPPWNGGRGHFGAAFSYLVAGGGFVGGNVIGVTDNRGEKVTQRAVYPCDLIGSVYYLMGIDPKSTIFNPAVGDIPVLPTLDKEGLSGGLLKEIMR